MAGRNLPLWPLGILVLLLVAASFAIGQFPVSLNDLLNLTFGKLFGPSPHVSSLVATVIFEVRLPRVLGALLVGGALAAAGAAYQGMFRNPLVSPDILGVSAGAGLGAVLGIFLSLTPAGVQALAFVFGLAAVALVYAIAARVRGNDPVLVLVLAGVVIGSLVGALISLLKIIADPYDQLPAMTFWLLGSLANVDVGDLKIAFPVVSLSLLPLYLLRWRMNILILHDEEGRALGVDTATLRIVFIIAATLMTSAVVAIGGMVGWVGLVIPHIARMLVGPEFGRLLPASMLLGAGFLLLVDNVARSITSSEIPLGILTALIGAPFFLWLLAAGRKPWQ